MKYQAERTQSLYKHDSPLHLERQRSCRETKIFVFALLCGSISARRELVDVLRWLSHERRYMPSIFWMFPKVNSCHSANVSNFSSGLKKSIRLRDITQTTPT
ncbi:hypothetical protein CA51_48730 [Rosistilla oblonga]|nr:hypothetical protein CA51_48730 [Rosistilla oblonga]